MFGHIGAVFRTVEPPFDTPDVRKRAREKQQRKKVKEEKIISRKSLVIREIKSNLEGVVFLPLPRLPCLSRIGSVFESIPRTSMKNLTKTCFVPKYGWRARPLSCLCDLQEEENCRKSQSYVQYQRFTNR